MSRYSLSLAMDRLSDDDQAALKELIRLIETHSAKHAKIISNLHREHFASADSMDAIVDLLLRLKSVPLEDLLQQLFRTYGDFQLVGGDAQMHPIVKRVGFSLTQYAILDYLKFRYMSTGLFTNDKDIEIFLNSKKLGQKTALDEDICIKGSTIWITWSADSDNPFDFFKFRHKAELYNALALSEFYLKDNVFVFETDLTKIQEKVTLSRPTIFDAGEYAPFLPAEITFKSHGFTDPYNNPTLVVEGEPVFSAKRPEAVIPGSVITWADVDKYDQI